MRELVVCGRFFDQFLDFLTTLVSSFKPQFGCVWGHKILLFVELINIWRDSNGSCGWMEMLFTQHRCCSIDTSFSIFPLVNDSCNGKEHNRKHPVQFKQESTLVWNFIKKHLMNQNNLIVVLCRLQVPQKKIKIGGRGGGDFEEDLNNCCQWILNCVETFLCQKGCSP
jgi:hypothetical protein